jgi:hypothetical protein
MSATSEELERMLRAAEACMDGEERRARVLAALKRAHPDRRRAKLEARQGAVLLHSAPFADLVTVLRGDIARLRAAESVVLHSFAKFDRWVRDQGRLHTVDRVNSSATVDEVREWFAGRVLDPHAASEVGSHLSLVPLHDGWSGVGWRSADGVVRVMDGVLVGREVLDARQQATMVLRALREWAEPPYTRNLDIASAVRGGERTGLWDAWRDRRSGVLDKLTWSCVRGVVGCGEGCGGSWERVRGCE